VSFHNQKQRTTPAQYFIEIQVFATVYTGAEELDPVKQKALIIFQRTAGKFGKKMVLDLISATFAFSHEEKE
jgi:hypothetical protein